MTARTATGTLTLRPGPDGIGAEIVLQNVPRPNTTATRRQLGQISSIHVFYDKSKRPGVLAFIGKRGHAEKFVFSAELSNQIIVAVISAHAHVPNLAVEVIDELTEPKRESFFACVLEAQGPRGRIQPRFAPTMAELQRKCDFPPTDGSFSFQSPSKRHALSGEELFERLRAVFGDELMSDFAALRQTHRVQLEELTRSLDGAEIKLTLGEDSNSRAETTAIITIQIKPHG